MTVIGVVVVAVRHVKFSPCLVCSTNRFQSRLNGGLSTRILTQIRMFLNAFEVFHANSKEVAEVAEHVFSDPLWHLDDIRVVILQDVARPDQAYGHFNHSSHVELGDEWDHI